MVSENKALLFYFSTKNFTKNYIFMIRKDWNFCNEILEVIAAISNKTFKIIIFIFSALILLFSKIFLALTLQHQPHKMVKHIQTIRRQTANELFECV